MKSRNINTRFVMTIGFTAIIVIAVISALVAYLLIKFVCKDHNYDYAIIIPAISAWIASLVYFLHKIDSYKHAIDIEHVVLETQDERSLFLENIIASKGDKTIIINDKNEIIEIDNVIDFFESNNLINVVKFTNTSKDSIAKINFKTRTNGEECDKRKNNAIKLLPHRWIWIVVGSDEEFKFIYWHLDKYSGGKRYVVN